MNKSKNIIYFPSFSSLSSNFKKDKLIFDNHPTKGTLPFKYYSKDYPERWRHNYMLVPAAEHYKHLDYRSKIDPDNECILLGDSGGFQVSSGVLEWSLDLREKLFNWLEHNSDYALNLDIPTFGKYAGQFDWCLKTSYENFKYFEQKQSGKTKYLNVLQANPNGTFLPWYNKVKGLEFNGWAIGGARNYILLTNAIAVLLQNREFENKNNKLLHILGRTKLNDFLFFAFLQKKINEKFNGNIQVSTDSSSPIQYSVYGIYLWGPNYKNGNFQNLYFGNKGKTNYIDESMLPCKIEGCPVCEGLNYKYISDQTPMSRNFITYHNLTIYQRTIEEVNKIISSHFELMEGFIDKGLYNIFKILNEMFDNPDQAISIFNKNKKTFESYKEKDTVLEDLELTNEFFE